MWRSALLLVLALAAPCSASPRFIPSPKQAFSEFVALNAPRAEVPVGALWIDGYGPTGEAAVKDNLVTERSLNGMLIDKNLQLAVYAGLFDLFGIEPRLRHHYSARFTDLSIIRVKDISRLAGPHGEPRIIEAMKAASIQISSDGEVGLNGRTGWLLQDYEGTTNNASGKRYNIEGRDLFIAIRIATQELVASDPQQLRLEQDGDDRTGRIDDFEIRVRQEGCPGSADCSAPVSVAITKLSTHPSEPATEFVSVDPAGGAKLQLPVPIADHEGGLYTHLTVHWLPSCRVRKERGCGSTPKLFAGYEGERVKDLSRPDMARW